MISKSDGGALHKSNQQQQSQPRWEPLTERGAIKTRLSPLFFFSRLCPGALNIQTMIDPHNSKVCNWPISLFNFNWARLFQQQPQEMNPFPDCYPQLIEISCRN